MIYSEEQIKDAAGSTLGGVPASWNLYLISKGLDLAPLNNQSAVTLACEIAPPVSTYLFWLLRVKGLKQLVHSNSILSAEDTAGFAGSYQEMADDAVLQAKLDVSNFVAEQDIVEDLSKLVESPVLSISALYRYIALQERSMEFLVSDELCRKAIKELRVNPYLYFVYGEEAVSLMPILWEEL